MPTQGVHTDRDRAELFGSVAEEYDRYRPTYPDALAEDLLALRPGRVLDVGCGTGKVAVALARHGVRVLGVEPDARMAAVARRHGVAVEGAGFESWASAGRRFDLITCGQAWHWIDPVLGVEKAREVLVPGGTIARFWNYHVFDDRVLAAFDAVYRDLATDLEGLGHDPVRSEDPPDPFENDSGFSPVERRTYRWTSTLTADDYVALVATFSDHQRLGPQRLAALQRALHTTIEGMGGAIHSRCGTYVRTARRNP